VHFGIHYEILIKIGAIYLDPQLLTLADYLFTYLFYFSYAVVSFYSHSLLKRKCDIQVSYQDYLCVYHYQHIMAWRKGQKVSIPI